MCLAIITVSPGGRSYRPNGISDTWIKEVWWQEGPDGASLSWSPGQTKMLLGDTGIPFWLNIGDKPVGVEPWPSC